LLFYDKAMKNIDMIFFTNSPKMKKIEAIIDEVAKTDIPILIKGESGTGKGLIADVIHLNSNRREKPFLRVNCAAIPKNLIESELFGFEKGAFTGAHLKKPGKFELANGGTILLNDIGGMDISVQAKLLQVLQNGEFSPLGGDGDKRVDTRVITTTNEHLERLLIEGRFREDLYFRINAMSITLPPLRERREQIPLFVKYFFDLYGDKYKKSIPFPSAEAMDVLKTYHWPGNIRELENVVKRIVLFGEEDTILQNLVSNRLREEGNSKHLDSSSPEGIRGVEHLCLKEVGKRAAETAEKKMIEDILQKTHWNRKQAAKLLGISYRALLYKIQRYHLNDFGRLPTIEEIERWHSKRSAPQN
jgi:two-component system response regulator AtoC